MRKFTSRRIHVYYRVREGIFDTLSYFALKNIFDRFLSVKLIFVLTVKPFLNKCFNQICNIYFQ